jgi:hypothetical protein
MGFERPVLKAKLQKYVYSLIFGQTYGNRETMQRIKRLLYLWFRASSIYFIK